MGESSRTGDPISGIEDAEAVEGAHVLHAGTATNDVGEVVSAGGRVLSVVGRGATLAAAREVAYEALSRIHLAGAHHRSDIALAASRGETPTGAIPDGGATGGGA